MIYFQWYSGDASDADATDEALCSVMKKMQEGTVTAGVLKSFAEIDPSVDFYIVGLKTNSSRIAVKFIYRRKFGDILSEHSKASAGYAGA